MHSDWHGPLLKQLGTRLLQLGSVFLLLNCTPKITPYQNGPGMSKKSIHKTFRPILDFMEVKPGISLADVSAGSGAITVMMAVLLDVIYTNATIHVFTQPGLMLQDLRSKLKPTEKYLFGIALKRMPKK